MHKQNTLSPGFTIVELLIVIVVIAILAAISVVAYSGIQNRANDTTVQSDLSNMAKKIELEAVDSGQYVVPTAGTGIRISRGAYYAVASVNNVYFCLNTSTNQYAISARSKSLKFYKYLNGSVSEHGSALYSTETCALVGGSSGAVGWNGSTQTWAAWVGN